MAKQIISFQKISTAPATELSVGRIYFETSTGVIKVATSSTATETYGGVLDASLSNNILTLKKSVGADVVVDLRDVASAAGVAAELAKKLNIGTEADASTVKSYFGLKKFTQESIANIPAAVVYTSDGSTITNSGTSTVTFAVGAIPQAKVTGLVAALDGKASDAELSAVRNIATAAAPQATTYTKQQVDNAVATAVGVVYRMKGSITDAAALLALTGVVIGDTYNVIAAGTINGAAFEAGSNFVATKAGLGNQANLWDKLGGTIDLSAYAKTSDIQALDRADTAVSGQVVSSVSQANGLITVSRRALINEDIPAIPISKVTGLDSALAGKVPTTRTVNSKPLSANVVLAGTDLLVGGSGTYGAGNIQAAVEAMDGRITVASSSGVQSFAGKTGGITLKAIASASGAVNLSMSNNELQAAIVGLGTAAYTGVSAFATSAQGALASSALQKADIATGTINGTISVDKTNVSVFGLGSAAYQATSAFDAAGTAAGLMQWADFA
ncbi:MAG: hypothetical protein RRY26_03360 [Cellulosilyticaceae bacterium]